MVVCAPCGSGLGRDAASAGRRLRSRTQSRASSLPQPSAQDRATDFRGRQPLLRTGPESGAARCPPPPSGSRPLPQSLAPAVDRLRPLLEQPLVAAALLWERPWPRRGRWCPQASIQAAVGVGRPLPQDPGSGRGSCVLPVGAPPIGAALAATRPLLSAGFDPGRCRGHKTPPTKPDSGRGSCVLPVGAPPVDTVIRVKHRERLGQKVCRIGERQRRRG
jgi:hypothetical protein